jgi:tetratricopeptide (TPR) repeat protein
MQKSQLIQVLRTFSRKELRDLGKWVESPAHNQRQDVVNLYGFLTEKDRLYCDELLSKTDVFSYVYPKEDYDDARFRQTMYFLMKVVEDYLVFQELSSDPSKVKLALAKFYRKRKLKKGVVKSLRQAKEVLEKQSHRNEHFYRVDYDILQEQYLFQSQQKRITSYNLQELSEALDISYLAEKLRQGCHMLTHQKVYKAEYNIGLIEPVLRYIEEKKYDKIPAVGVYYHGLKTLTNVEEEDHFQHLKSLILEHYDLFPKSEMRDLYLMAINYCIGRMNVGKESFIAEAFALYRKGVESFILIENEQISRWTFRNVVSTGLKVKEIEWVEQFISEYQTYLEKEYQESMVQYCSGILFTAKGDYAQAMSLFSQADYKDVLLTLNAKSMLLKMYYEQDELDALESLIDSMQAFVRRKEVIGYHKQSYKNIVRLTKKLLRVNPFNSKEVKTFKEEVTEVSPMTMSDRQWLLKQIEQL